MLPNKHLIKYKKLQEKKNKIINLTILLFIILIVKNWLLKLKNY